MRILVLSTSENYVIYNGKFRDRDDDLDGDFEFLDQEGEKDSNFEPDSEDGQETDASDSEDDVRCLNMLMKSGTLEEIRLMDINENYFILKLTERMKKMDLELAYNGIYGICSLSDNSCLSPGDVRGMEPRERDLSIEWRESMETVGGLGLVEETSKNIDSDTSNSRKRPKWNNGAWYTPPRQSKGRAAALHVRDYNTHCIGDHFYGSEKEMLKAGREYVYGLNCKGQYVPMCLWSVLSTIPTRKPKSPADILGNTGNDISDADLESKLNDMMTDLEKEQPSNEHSESKSGTQNKTGTTYNDCSDERNVDSKDGNFGGKRKHNHMEESIEIDDGEEIRATKVKMKQSIKRLLKLKGLPKSKRVFYTAVLEELESEESCPNEDILNTINAFVSVANGKIFVPEKFKDIKGNKFEEEWLEACRQEIAAHQRNRTWELVELPNGKRVIGSRWTFVLKLNADGTIKRFKARFVAQGFTQTFGLDFLNTYAPVVGMSTVRWLLSLACANNWKVYQMDIETAFLYAEVKEEIYVKQPEGFQEGGPNKVLKLLKALYGLRQAPHEFNKLLDDFLRKTGKLNRTKADYCLYHGRSIDGKLILVAVFVDDILITGNWTERIEKLKLDLGSRFTMKDLGEVYQCLGFIVERDYNKGTLKLHQKPYIEKLLERFEYNSYRVSTPAEENTYHQVENFYLRNNIPETVDYPYHELIGGLLYLAVTSRPDIANIVRILVLLSFIAC